MSLFTQVSPDWESPAWFSSVYESWIFVPALFDCSFDFASTPTQVLSLLVGSTCTCPHSPERRSNQRDEITCVGLRGEGKRVVCSVTLFIHHIVYWRPCRGGFFLFLPRTLPVTRSNIIFLAGSTVNVRANLSVHFSATLRSPDSLSFRKWVMHDDPWTLYSQMRYARYLKHHINTWVQMIHVYSERNIATDIILIWLRC